MRDSAHREVAPFDLWQASMMANAVRDPLFRAQVSAEMAATPALAASISQKCLTCHAPMAATNAVASGQSLSLSELTQDTTRSQLALDGVSCTLCHAVQPNPQNVSASFSGQFPLGPAGQLFGPHQNPFSNPMVMRSGFTPVAANHSRSSSLCASCHTLYTDAHDANGVPTGGRLPEQTPYLEWQNSVYNDEIPNPSTQAASCQACHVPPRDDAGAAIRTRIARTPSGQDFGRIPLRDPYGRHLFVGGNTLIPAILRDQRANLRPPASDSAFNAVIAEARAQLRQRTATLTLAVTRSGDRLSASVTVLNVTGHKFPTGHPVRRAWLRVRVYDRQGRLVLASGEHDTQGRLVDAVGAVLPSEVAGGPTQPHRRVIDQGSQVQIYQSVMADATGSPTWLLLRGESYLKDNRLLPTGWSATHASASDTQPRGGAASDSDFRGGRDVVRYDVQAPQAAGPYRIESTLLYQPLGARYAVELFQFRTPEILAFETYYQAANKTPEVVAQASANHP